MGPGLCCGLLSVDVPGSGMAVSSWKMSLVTSREFMRSPKYISLAKPASGVDNRASAARAAASVLHEECMALRKTTKRLYLIPVLSKALDILELLQVENQPMTLESIHLQTKLSETTVYLVLKPVVHRGYLSQSPGGRYRTAGPPS